MSQNSPKPVIHLCVFNLHLAKRYGSFVNGSDLLFFTDQKLHHTLPGQCCLAAFYYFITIINMVCIYIGCRQACRLGGDQELHHAFPGQCGVPDQQSGHKLPQAPRPTGQPGGRNGVQCQLPLTGKGKRTVR